MIPIDSIAAALTRGALSVSDEVLIFSTLFLGVSALVAPAVSDAIKHWWVRPKLSLRFRLARPACHRTTLAYTLGNFQQLRDAVFIYRCEVFNDGRSQARRCEVVLVGLDTADAAGRFHTFPTFTPVSLVWGSGYDDFVDINPKRRFYCDLLSIPGLEYQRVKRDLVGGWVDPPGVGPYDLGVVLNSRAAFFSQPNRLPAGRYRLHLALFAENAQKVEATLSLSWTGQWKDAEEDMFKECAVTE